MFLLEIVLIFIFANLGGYIAKKLKQPVVLGQIVAGILIGPAIFGLVTPNETLGNMADIGVILLMFMAGLETDIQEMKESGKASTLIAIGGVFVPAIFSMGVAYAFGLEFNQMLFLGVITTATSVSISVQTLREMNQLSTKQGVTILSSAIIDDILGIILLTLVVAAVSPTSGESIFLVIGKILLFFAIVVILAIGVSKFLAKHAKTMETGSRIVHFSLIFCLALAFLAEELGVAAITGAYFAGLTLSTTDYKNKITYNIENIAYSIFTPIFFVSIGFKVSFTGMDSILLFGSIVVLVAVIGKLFGCGLMARLNGFDRHQSLQIGIGMIPRAEVALIVTDLGMSLGIIGQDIFTTVILMVLSTTLITPPLLKAVFPEKQAEHKVVY